MLRFQTLGSLDLRAGDGAELTAVLAQPKRLALLAYLAVTRPSEYRRRDTLLACFWPESDEAHARASLSSSLRFLRQHLGSDVIVGRGAEEIRLDSGRFWTDAVAFQQTLDAGSLEDALGLYRGDLLEGFHISDAPTFEDWLERERVHLRGYAVRAATELANRASSTGEHGAAVVWARRAASLAPGDEGAVRVLIERLAASGDHSTAMHVYEEFKRRLAMEFEVVPSRDTQAVATAVRSVPTSLPGTPFTNSASVPATLGVHDSLSASSDPTSRVWRPHRRSRWGMGARFATTLLVLTVAGLAIVRAIRKSGSIPRMVHRQLTFVGNAFGTAVSPDGRTLAYAVRAGDSVQVLAQDVAGGAADTLATFPWIMTLEWSPSSDRLLVGLSGRAVVLPRHGRSARSIGTSGGFSYGVHAHWLPDGSRVSLHEDGSKQVLVFDLETETSTSIQVAGDYTWLRPLSWSPSGTSFAVPTWSDNPLRWTLRTVTLSGHTEVVAEDSVQLSSPRWTPNGDAVYYLRNTDAIRRVRISTRTGKPRGTPEDVRENLEILPRPRSGASNFSLTRDGRQMVYARGTRFSNLWILKATDASPRGPTRPLTNGTTLRWNPVVSPDGRWIAFAQQVPGGNEVFRMPIEGGTIAQITIGARVWPNSGIAWSPDGRHIAFESVRAGRTQIWLAAVEDGRLRPLANTNASSATPRLAWAPGAQIAYPRFDHENINLVDPESGRERPLVRDTAPPGLFSPQYSPNGRKLAVWWSRRLKDPGVWVFDLQDSSRVHLQSGMGLEPRGWSPDGRYIYAGGRTLFRIDTHREKPMEPILTVPFRETECTSAGPQHPDAFVCVAFDFVSDIWMLDNFNADSR
jgi:Tol biopolymer transport system component/DNA-binding SARP family transcriptional activator